MKKRISVLLTVFIFITRQSSSQLLRKRQSWMCRYTSILR